MRRVLTDRGCSPGRRRSSHRRRLHQWRCPCPCHHYAEFIPAFGFPLETVAVLIAVVVLGAVVATIGPARRAVRISVLSALRHE